MLPSASGNDVGTLDLGDFAAQYLACVHPCQRFAIPSRTVYFNGGSALGPRPAYA